MENKGNAVGLAVVPVIVVTAIWVIVGGIVPLFIKGPNKRLIQTMLVMTAVCCWLFWICAYFCQLNPLIGPEIQAGALRAAVKEWGGKDV
ncbi:V-type proton ATPase subunit e [Pocillopora verrucosa]|uniref:V-type proton ATPase subunit e n=1 Tax=Pocillopora verrucosa TaxID=203993 RepID=UPI00333E59FB